MAYEIVLYTTAHFSLMAIADRKQNKKTIKFTRKQAYGDITYIVEKGSHLFTSNAWLIPPPPPFPR